MVISHLDAYLYIHLYLCLLLQTHAAHPNFLKSKVSQGCVEFGIRYEIFPIHYTLQCVIRLLKMMLINVKIQCFRSRNSCLLSPCYLMCMTQYTLRVLNHCRLRHPLRTATRTNRHYAGDISYTVTGWIDKNNDTLQDDLLEILQGSNCDIISRVSSS